MKNRIVLVVAFVLLGSESLTGGVEEAADQQRAGIGGRSRIEGPGFTEQGIAERSANRSLDRQSKGAVRNWKFFATSRSGFALTCEKTAAKANNQEQSVLHDLAAPPRVLLWTGHANALRACLHSRNNRSWP